MSRVNSEYLRDAFTLYKWYDVIALYDEQIIRLALSELFFDQSRAFICYQITDSILAEQIRISKEKIDIYENFLEKHVP